VGNLNEQEVDSAKKVYPIMSYRYTVPVKSVAENLHQIRQEVIRTAISCGRQPETIQILAVSKTMEPWRIMEAYEAGQRLFGENRVQEAFEKIPALRDKEITWHFIGHLQSNKTRAAVELFDVIQTVHNPKLARRLNLHCQELGKKSIDVMIQVNQAEEPQKSGVRIENLTRMISVVDDLPNLNLVGLMTIPPFSEDQEKSRPYFRQLRQLRDQINLERKIHLQHLSMGIQINGVWLQRWFTYLPKNADRLQSPLWLYC